MVNIEMGWVMLTTWQRLLKMEAVPKTNTKGPLMPCKQGFIEISKPVALKDAQMRRHLHPMRLQTLLHLARFQ